MASSSHRRGCFAFVLPQLLFGLVGSFIGLASKLVRTAGGMRGFWNGVVEGEFSMPAARVGPEILVVLVAIVFAVLCVVLYAFTLNGLLGVFVGFLGGVVAAGLYDVVRLRGTLEADDPFVIKRVAGYGSIAALVLALIVLAQADVVEAAGTFYASGILLWSFGAIVGIPIFLVRRSRAR